MRPAKRAMDIFLALFLLLVLAPVGLVLIVLIRFRDGAPVFYVSERMTAPDRPFMLWKFRTMRPTTGDSGVSGGEKSDRITSTGRILRRLRLDELPQLWNILKGDMSFVGPRPPLRQYVERFPDLYAKVLRNRPGVTGLATLVFHAREEKLLSACHTAEETDEVYTRICVPRKARLDLIYQDHANPCYDLVLLGKTIGRVLRR